jgi:hypothetical protein
MLEQAGCGSAVGGEDPGGGLTDRSVRLTENRNVTKLPAEQSLFVTPTGAARETRPDEMIQSVEWLTYFMEHSPFEKLTGSQLVKKFPAFYGTRRFITAFTSDRHLSIS